MEIDSKTIDMIKDKKGVDTTKVINLIKSIEKAAEEQSDDPCPIAMAERARAIQENFEEHQKDTAECVAELLNEIVENEQRKKEQAEKGLDVLTFFVYRTLLDAGLKNAGDVSKKIKEAFAEQTHWRRSEKELRELRQMITFAVCAEDDDFYKATAIVDNMMRLLEGAYKI